MEAKKSLFRMVAEDFKGLPKLWPYLRQSKKLLWIALLLIPIISGLQTVIPLLLQYTVDEGIIKGDMTVIGWGALAYIGMVTLEYVARGGQGLSAAFAVHRMILSMRRKLFVHVLDLSASYHDRSMSGALVTRATSDFDNLSESLNHGVLTSVVDCAVLLGCLIGMFILSWELSLAALAILPFVAWIVAFFSRGLKRTMLQARKKIAALNAFSQECLYGQSTIKLLTAEKHAQEKFDGINEEYRQAQMKSVILDALMFSVLDGLASITLGLVLWTVASQFFGPSMLSAGIIVGFVRYIQQFFEPLKMLGSKMAMLQGAFTAIDRVFGVLDTEEFVASGKTDLPPLSGNITFDNVRFAYRSQEPGEQDRTVLQNLSFKMSAGQSLALVGATGGGKSTIIKLLTKMYDGYEGKITVDGFDVRSLDGTALRRQIGIVPQDIVLFDGTIRFNIGLGDQRATEDRIREAAKAVQADQFIERLPGGYDFEIREQGSNLSHGQRQLISFARAIAKDPKIVILDEATSSVDPESEALIQTAMDGLFRDRCVIVVAHRLATIRRCDQILVIQQGQLIESGTHDDLLSKRQAYYALHQAMA